MKTKSEYEQFIALKKKRQEYLVFQINELKNAKGFNNEALTEVYNRYASETNVFSDLLINAKKYEQKGIEMIRKFQKRNEYLSEFLDLNIYQKHEITRNKTIMKFLYNTISLQRKQREVADLLLSTLEMELLLFNGSKFWDFKISEALENAKELINLHFDENFKAFSESK
jgi:hypothetical protein